MQHVERVLGHVMSGSSPSKFVPFAYGSDSDDDVPEPHMAPFKLTPTTIDLLGSDDEPVPFSATRVAPPPPAAPVIAPRPIRLESAPPRPVRSARSSPYPELSSDVPCVPPPSLFPAGNRPPVARRVPFRNAPAHDAVPSHHRIAALEPLPLPLPTTVDTAADEWTEFKVYMRPDNKWWTWDRGIIDIRLRSGAAAQVSEGSQFRRAFSDIQWVLRRHPCEFKVGITGHIAKRWCSYNQPSSTWVPSHLFFLLMVPGRIAAGYVEGGLICACESLDLDHGRFNINLRHKDSGGTGANNGEFAEDDHFIYLAVRPVDIDE